MLNALEICQTYKSVPGLSWTFNAVSGTAMAALGAAFAPVVLDESSFTVHEDRLLRVGLWGPSGSGKTTFAFGMLNTIPHIKWIETVTATSDEQNLWQLQNGLWIRHYDAAYHRATMALSSYWNNKARPDDAPFVDLVEHPMYDKNNLLFDCLIFIRQAHAETRERLLTVTPSPAFAALPQFQDFLRKAAGLEPL